MKASQRSLQFALVYCQLRRRHLYSLLWMMRHEPDNPGFAAFTSNCTSVGSTSKEPGRNRTPNPSAPEAAPLPIRQRPLALWAWLVRVFAPSGGANKAACSCPSSVQVCWGNLNLDKNLDKELGQILSCVFLLQSHLSKFPRRTWARNLDNCRLPC